MMPDLLIVALIVWGVILVYDSCTYEPLTSDAERRHQEALKILADARAVHDVIASTLA